MESRTVLTAGVCLAGILILLFSRTCIFDQPEHAFPVAGLKNNPAPDMIILHYHERPPYYVTGPGGVRGLCVDPVKQAFEAAQIPFRMERTPAKRQLEIIKKNKAPAGALGWFKTPVRERFARFSLPIYQDRPTIALARKQGAGIVSGLPLDRILLNRNLVLLVKDGYSYGGFIDERVAAIQPVIETTTADNLGMLRMIQAGRADYFFIALEEADVLIANSGLPKHEFRYIRFSDMPEGNHRHVMFSKKAGKDRVARINAAIPTLNADKPVR